MDIPPIQIPNGTHQVIIQLTNNTNDAGLIYATLALVIATLGGIIISGALTVWSNSILIRELKQKYKPLFDFRDPKIYGENLAGRDIWHFICEMWNIGKVAVHDVSIYHVEHPFSITLDDIIRNQTIIKSHTPEKIDSTLEPEHYHALDFQLQQFDPKQGARVVIWLEYRYLYGKEEGIAFLDHYANGQTGYTWFDNSYIQKRRLELST